MVLFQNRKREARRVHDQRGKREDVSQDRTDPGFHPRAIQSLRSSGAVTHGGKMRRAERKRRSCRPSTLFSSEGSIEKASRPKEKAEPREAVMS